MKANGFALLEVLISAMLLTLVAGASLEALSHLLRKQSWLHRADTQVLAMQTQLVINVIPGLPE